MDGIIASIEYNIVILTNISYNLAQVTMALTFVKLASQHHHGSIVI
jgi:hypothetical protein